MKILKFAMLIFLTFSIVQCTNEVENDIQPESTTTQREVSAKILSQLEKMGFDTKTKVPRISSNDNKIIVEGDIVLDKKVILNYVPSKQGFNTIASCNRVKNIRVRNTLGNTAAGRSVQEAINLWNNVGASTVRFVQVNTPSFDILIQAGIVGGGSPADADSPDFNTRRVGRLVRVDQRIRTFDNKIITQRQWSRIIAHELGHTIGFRHSGDNQGPLQLVSGTPIVDNQSIMAVSVRIGAPGSLENLNDLSRNDKIAVARMYSNRNDRLCR